MSTRTTLLVLVAVAAGAVGGALVGLVWWLVDGSDPAGSASSGCPVTQVAREVLPSVVTVDVEGPGGRGNGTGVLVDLDDGPTYVVTNDHVVESEPGSAIRVTFSDGRSSDATVVGADRLTDLAVLEAADLSPDAAAIEMGDSGGLRVGAPVVALGAPLGLTSTVTHGIVSATGRYVRLPAQDAASRHLIGAIQTDAAINPGNSGGALVDCSGRLVGINTAGATVEGESGSNGLGFAIPVSLVETLAPELVETGRVAHPTLGVQVQAVPDGLFVQAVLPGGPAAQAGLRAGDVIVEVDGATIEDQDGLVRFELSADVGDTAALTVDREGVRSTLEVTLGSA